VTPEAVCSPVNRIMQMKMLSTEQKSILQEPFWQRYGEVSGICRDDWAWHVTRAISGTRETQCIPAAMPVSLTSTNEES
jgi:hypothetical protein